MIDQSLYEDNIFLPVHLVYADVMRSLRSSASWEILCAHLIPHSVSSAPNAEHFYIGLPGVISHFWI